MNEHSFYPLEDEEDPHHDDRHDDDGALLDSASSEDLIPPFATTTASEDPAATTGPLDTSLDFLNQEIPVLNVVRKRNLNELEEEEQQPHGGKDQEAQGSNPQKRIRTMQQEPMGARNVPAAHASAPPVSASSSNPAVWTNEMHRDFVEAIYRVGVSHASPSVILEMMVNEQNLPITAERVKSRLQKYRNSAEKSCADFMHEYDDWTKKAWTVGAAGGAATTLASPTTVLDMMGVSKLLGGDLAAFLTYCCRAEEQQQQLASSVEQQPASLTSSNMAMPGLGIEHREEGLGVDTDGGGAASRIDARSRPTLPGGAVEEESTAAATPTPAALWRGSQEYAKVFCSGAEIRIPRLSAAEQQSPLGISLQHVVRTFYSMTQHLMQERDEARRRNASQSPPVQPVSHRQQPPQQQAGKPSPSRARASSDAATALWTLQQQPSALPPPPMGASSYLTTNHGGGGGLQQQQQQQPGYFPTTTTALSYRDLEDAHRHAK